MSRGPHFYRNLDSGEYRHSLTVEVPMRKLAEELVDINYSVHRLLSHLIDVRAEQLAARVADYRAKGDDDVALYAERAGDPLMEGIRKLLEEGHC